MGRRIGILALAARLAAFGIACSSFPTSATATVSSVNVTGSAPALGGTVSATSSPDTFDVQVELQGLYDEISQIDVPFMTQSDVDLFHDVLYTPDWVFVDALGQKQTWLQMREHAMQASSAPPLDSMIQRIQKLSLVPDGASTVVNVTTVRTIVDAGGRYGRQGASHTLTETTLYRDRWTRVSDEWKLKSREQISPSTVSVDRPEWSI